MTILQPWSLTILLLLMVGLGILLAPVLSKLTWPRKRTESFWERLQSAIQSLFLADSGGTVTTANAAELIVGNPASTTRLLKYSGIICLTTLVVASSLSRWRRVVLIRKQVERVRQPTRESAQDSNTLQKLYTTIAQLAESVSYLKSEAGKNTRTERSTHTLPSSRQKKSPAGSSNPNGQKELHDFVAPPDEE